MTSEKAKGLELAREFERVGAQISDSNVGDFRRLYHEMCAGADFRLSGEYTVYDEVVTGGPDGLRLRIFRPNGYGQFPISVLFHGGWWVAGDLDSSANICKVIADTANVVVICPEYRLAPEARFPAPFEDALRALEWAVANAAHLDGDAEVVAVVGEGSGATLAAFVTQQAHSRIRISPTLQLLIDPVFTDGLFPQASGSDYSSVIAAVESFGRAELLWNASGEQAAWLGDGIQVVAEGAQVPAVTLVVGGKDTLANASVDRYLKDLMQAGAAVGLRFYHDQPQGFVAPYGDENSAGGKALRYAARMLRYSLRQGWDPLLALER